MLQPRAAAPRLVHRSGNRLQAPGKFLWLDDDAKRPPRLRNGEIEILPLRNHGFDHVPNGLIHDWIGAIFVPEASLSQVIGLLTDYDRYDTIYHPEVVDAKLLSHSTDKDEFSMRLANKVLFVSTGIDVQCIGRTVRVDDHRANSLSYTTRIEEIENYG